MTGNTVRSTLTDVGHTAVGLAALATKRALEVRLELADRFEPQFVDARARALQVVDAVEAARTRVGQTVDPLVDLATGRLPEPVQEVVGEYRRAVRRAQGVAHDVTVKVIEAATAVPPRRAPRTGASTASRAAAATRAAHDQGTEVAAPPPAAGRAAKATPSRTRTTGRSSLVKERPATPARTPATRPAARTRTAPAAPTARTKAAGAPAKGRARRPAGGTTPAS